MLKISLSATFLVFLSLILFLSETAGFDFYAHSMIYYFYDQNITHSYMFFDSVVVPRYFLLSIVFETFSRIGVPLGYIVMALVILPVYTIFSSISRRERGDKLSIFSVLMIFMVFVLTFFYSGLSLVILFAIAYFLTLNRFFLIGGLFHPVGCPLFIVLLFIYRIKDLFFFLLLITFTALAFWLSSQFNLFTSCMPINIKFFVNIESALDLLLLSYSKKKTEIIVAILLSLALIIFKKKSNLSVLRVYIHKKLALLLFICFVAFVGAYMYNKPGLSFIKSIITARVDDVMYATWFDWGEKDLILDYHELYHLRYTDVEEH